MINEIYQLIRPNVISIEQRDEDIDGKKLIVRPEYMAICHADQRYFQGRRAASVLRKKLPMALIHECCGRVVYDPNGEYKGGELVAMIPNIPGEDNDYTFENYSKGSKFLSSGIDGFMREFVSIEPDRVVSAERVNPKVAAITEFISVAVHATNRFDIAAHKNRKRIGIWGDGSMAYVVANVLHMLCPESELYIIGKHERKLAQFSFAKKTFITNELPDSFEIDHAFECCGNMGSEKAVSEIIGTINPQGTIMLMGVSENGIVVNTRMVLEKGLTLVGCSRSGYEDFEKAIALLKDESFANRISSIIFEDKPVRSIGDIYDVFSNDLANPFKTVFKWEL